MAEQDPEIVAALDQGQYNVKYQAPNTPLEAEERLKMMVPLPWYSDQRYREWYNRAAPAMPELQGILAKEMSDKQKQIINTEFAYEFQKWLMGRSYWNLAVAKDGITPLTPWRCTPRTDIEGVVEYERQWPQKRAEFQLALVKLWMLGPKNLNEAFLYYKYLVCGETLDPVYSDDIRFLDEYAIFFPDSEAFYNVTNYGVMPHKNRKRVLPHAFPYPIEFATDQLLWQQSGNGHAPFPTINPQTYRDGFNPGYNVGPPGAPGGPGGGGGGGGPGFKQVSDRLDLLMQYFQHNAAGLGNFMNQNFNDIGRVLMQNQDDMRKMLNRFESVDQLAQHLNDQKPQKVKKEHKSKAGRTAEDGAMQGVPIAQELKNLYDAVESSKDPQKDFETFLERISKSPLSQKDREMAKGIYEMFQNAGTLEAVQEAQNQLEIMRQRQAEAQNEAERIRKMSVQERMELDAQLQAESLKRQEHERHIAKQTELLREAQAAIDEFVRQQRAEKGKMDYQSDIFRRQIADDQRHIQEEREKQMKLIKIYEEALAEQKQTYEQALAKTQATGISIEDYNQAVQKAKQAEGLVNDFQNLIHEDREKIQKKDLEMQAREHQFQEHLANINRIDQENRLKFEALERELRETVQNREQELKNAFQNGVNHGMEVKKQEIHDQMMQDLAKLKDVSNALLDERMGSGENSDNESDTMEVESQAALLSQIAESIKPSNVFDIFQEHVDRLDELGSELHYTVYSLERSDLSERERSLLEHRFEDARANAHGLIEGLQNLANEQERILLDAEIKNVLGLPGNYNLANIRAIPTPSSIHKPAPQQIIDVKPPNLSSGVPVVFDQNHINESKEIIREVKEAINRVDIPHIPTSVERVQESVRQASGTQEDPIEIKNETKKTIKKEKNPKRDYDKLREKAAEAKEKRPQFIDFSTPPTPTKKEVSVVKPKFVPSREVKDVFAHTDADIVESRLSSSKKAKRERPIPEPVSQSSPLPPSEASPSKTPPPEVPKSQRVIKLVQKFKNDQEKRRFDKEARLHMKTILDSIEAKTYNFRNIDNDIQNVLTNYPSDSHIGHKLGTLLFNMAISNPDDQVKTTDVYKFMQGKALINMYPLFNEVEDTVYEWFEKAGQKTDIFEQMPEEVAKIKAALVMALQQMKTERGKAYGDTEQPEAYLRILKLLPALKKALEHEYKGTYSKRK